MSVGARCTAMLRHPPSFYVKFFALTILFFLSSGGLTLYNKWIISIYGFDFPVWLVTITYTCAAVFSISTRLLASLPVRCCRTGCCRKLLRRAGVVPFHEDSLNFRKVAAIAGVGSMAAIEVASSNVSLLYLDVSYHIMLRAGIPVFVLLWAFALGLDKPSCRLAAVVLFICGGVAVLTYGENMTVNSAEDVGSEDADSDGTPDAIDEAKTFSWTGTAYVLLSCFCAGLKWALSELTLGGAKVGKALKASSGGGSCCLCSYSQVPRRRVHPSQPRARIEVAIEDDADNSNDDSNPRTTEATTTASTPQKAEIKAKETDNKHMAETPRRMSPFSLLSTTAFVSAISLLPIDFLSDEFQGLKNYTEGYLQASSSNSTPLESAAGVHFTEVALVLIGCSLISVVLTMVTFLFIKLTSGLTLSIVNIAKQLVVIGISIAVYGDDVTWVTLVGFGLCVVGLGWFNYVKFTAHSA